MSAPLIAASKPLAGRAVHIKVQPKTRSIRESREILRALKNFGDVTSFHNLQYDATNPAPHTVLAVFKSSQSASDLIAAAPIRVAIPPPPLPRPVTSPASHALLDFFQDKTLSASGSRDEPHGHETEIMLHADYSSMDHQSAVQHKPHFWGYPVVPRTFAQQTLLREVPEPGLAMIGGIETPLVNRIVKKNLERVAQRKPVREILQERTRST